MRDQRRPQTHSILWARSIKHFALIRFGRALAAFRVPNPLQVSRATSSSVKRDNRSSCQRDFRCAPAHSGLYSRAVRNPFVQYLIGAGIFSIGLMILLSSAEIAHSLGRFWYRWTGKLRRDRADDDAKTPPPFYRTRLVIWRTLGVLIVADGLIWLVLATAEVCHVLPRAR